MQQKYNVETYGYPIRSNTNCRSSSTHLHYPLAIPVTLPKVHSELPHDSSFFWGSNIPTRVTPPLHWLDLLPSNSCISSLPDYQRFSDTLLRCSCRPLSLPSYPESLTSSLATGEPPLIGTQLTAMALERIQTPLNPSHNVHSIFRFFKSMLLAPTSAIRSAHGSPPPVTIRKPLPLALRLHSLPPSGHLLSSGRPTPQLPR